MKSFETAENLPAAAKGAALAIGNFDGVHRGHRALFAAMGEGRRAVLTFEPHPRKLFEPDGPPFRITPAAVKARLLEECGIDTLIALPFDWDFASQSADEFIGRILKKIAPGRIVIGPDFRFGQLRKGTPQMLADAGFDVTVLEKKTDDSGETISSSAIRESIRHGDIAAANVLLGHDWTIEGAVVRGDRRGRELGFPTANVMLGDTIHPAYGIYAALVNIEGETHWRASATNIGIRPMFEVRTGQVEAHILDFAGDIYGRVLRVKPVKKLRGEAKFDSLDALIGQISQDCDQARKILSA